MANEEWKNFDVYTGTREEIKLQKNTYKVSNQGRIKSGNAIIKPGLVREMNCVSLKTIDGKDTRCNVHNLVAYNFVDNDDPKTKTIIRHKDGNKKNNVSTNLEWISQKQNNEGKGHAEKRAQECKNAKEKFIKEHPETEGGEKWKDCVGFENLYMVSNLGNVYTLKSDSSMNVAKGRVKLRDANNKVHMADVHQLVAKAFIKNDNPEKHNVVHHKDGNPLNNKVDNLEWTDRSNVRKQIHIRKGDQTGAVNQYDTNNKLIKTWNSINEAIEQNPEYNRSTIVGNIRGDHKTAYGYIWKFVEEKNNDDPKLEADEEFKKLVKYGEFTFDNYEVSNYGKVRNLTTKKFLKPSLNDKGYYQYCLIDKDKNKATCTSHRLVAVLYVGGGTEEKKYVNHIDENPKNNYYKNLEWTTNQQNTIHSTGKRVHKLNKKTGMLIETFPSLSLAVISCSGPETSATSISDCCKGTKPSYRGFRWRYAEEPVKTITDCNRIDKIRKELREILLDPIAKTKARYDKMADSFKNI